MKRVNVSVQAQIDRDGHISPQLIQWADGRMWRIERVLHSCRSPDLSFAGFRYTVLIDGKERYLYRDGTVWYVFASQGG